MLFSKKRFFGKKVAAYSYEKKLRTGEREGILAVETKERKYEK